MNVFVCSGNLGNNAEQRTTQGGTAVCQFSLAVTSGYGDKKQTTWVRCNLWGNRGESLAPYLLKGTQVVVSGEISLRTWEKDGKEKTSLELRVNDLTLVGGKREGTQTQQASAPARNNAPEPAGGAYNDFDQDIPFSNYEYRTFA